MCQFLHPLKSSNFDPRTYLRHLCGNISKKNFRVPGHTGHGDTDLQNPQNPKNAHVQAKKINVPELISLKYGMLVISK